MIWRFPIYLILFSMLVYGLKPAKGWNKLSGSPNVAAVTSVHRAKISMSALKSTPWVQPVNLVCSPSIMNSWPVTLPNKPTTHHAGTSPRHRMQLGWSKRAAYCMIPVNLTMPKPRIQKKILTRSRPGLISVAKPVCPEVTSIQRLRAQKLMNRAFLNWMTKRWKANMTVTMPRWQPPSVTCAFPSVLVTTR